MDKIYLALLEWKGTDDEYGVDFYACRTEQEAGETVSSLMADIAKDYNFDIDPTKDWFVRGDGFWFRGSIRELTDLP